ncbi:MAG: hypothetical protein JWN48_5631 [Myxococcaceae bacterium]|nr:hypothetical protein [Myxococcaceae bacterium]
MARPTLELIGALRVTATRLSSGATYKWSHFGQCNCGNLAQTVTQLTPEQVYRAAFERSGDWGEQAREFCPTSGYPIDFVLQRLFDMGVEQTDIRHLERLSDDRVLKRLGVVGLAHNDRQDVVRYMQAWADLLEDALPPAAAWEPFDHRNAAE